MLSDLRAALREFCGMMRFLFEGLWGTFDDRFFRGRASYNWDKSLAKIMLQRYPHMEGRWAVVTGANSGIGYELSLLLAKCGISVILACRSDSRGKEAEQSIRAAAGEGAKRVEYVNLDISDLESVKCFAKSMQGRDVGLLVCNAGAMCLPWSLTPQGFETVFGGHVIGHALLAELLVPELLRCSKGTARIVHCSSRTVEKGSFVKECFARPEKPLKGFSKYSHYPNVKTMQTCCALAHADNLGSGNVAVHAVHPGCVQSNIVTNNALLGPFSPFFQAASPLVGQISPLEAASYLLRACLSDDCAPANGTGRFYHCGQLSVPGPLASDPQVRREAWSLLQQTLREGGWLK